MGKTLFIPYWQGKLKDYVTDLAWSSNGLLAASSALGEVVLWKDSDLSFLASASDHSIDALAFSSDGEFLATGGQNGQVKIWRLQPRPELMTTLNYAPKWIEKLAWSPTENLLAFSFGKFVQIFSVKSQEILTTLNFADSSVLAIDWRPNGQELALAGNHGLKVWHTGDWDEDPQIINLGAASMAIAWSADGKYLASSNFGDTLTVLEWGNPNPWVMQGFPGKIRHLAWCNLRDHPRPLFATSSREAIVIWEKLALESQGWEARVLSLHDGVLTGLGFQPNSLLLASVAEDGYLGLWPKAKPTPQILRGVNGGFSALAWHLRGQYLAAAGREGELLIWRRSSQGQGFGY